MKQGKSQMTNEQMLDQFVQEMLDANLSFEEVMLRAAKRVAKLSKSRKAKVAKEPVRKVRRGLGSY